MSVVETLLESAIALAREGKFLECLTVFDLIIEKRRRESPNPTTPPSMGNLLQI